MHCIFPDTLLDQHKFFQKRKYCLSEQTSREKGREKRRPWDGKLQKAWRKTGMRWKNGSGLLIWGDVGTGKSFFAGCIANALLEKGVPVLMTNFSRILNTLTGMHFEDRNQFINNLNRYSLLIIDDLGIERNSDFALEQVFNVIDSRYRSKKPLIITTNLTLSELNNAADIAHKRIYDRILERCIPVRINNRNIRQDNATANLKQAKKILLNNHAPNQN